MYIQYVSPIEFSKISQATLVKRATRETSVYLVGD